MIPRYPRNITTERIKHGLDNQRITNGIRTIQRDMLVLEMAFRPRIRREKCKDKSVRWYWEKGAEVINPRVLTINQALSFILLCQSALKSIHLTASNNVQ